MRANGYGTYRGKSKLRIFLTVLVILLALVLVLAIGGFFFLGEYIVFSDDGLHLDLPFAQSKPTPTPTVEVSATLPLVVVTPTPPPTSAPAPVILRAIPQPLTAFADGTAPAALAAAGANAAIFDMKADSGDLGYASGEPLAAAAKTSSQIEGVNEQIKAYNAAADYTVARVSCFKDHKTAQADQDLPIRTYSNYRWTDPQDVIWTSPASEKAQGYLAAVCKELAELGFDEILLENAGYPTEGNLHYIKPGEVYDLEKLPLVVGGFYEEVRAALAGTGVKLSIVTTESALDATDQKSGQTPQNLGESADRIVISAPVKPEANYVKALEGAGATVTAGTIVTRVTTPLTDKT
ncbi:MAG: putative glycoside hydrolase, partial [Oscillospiraceae bacterium]